MPRRRPAPGGPCSSRSAGRPGAAPWLPGTAGRCRTAPAFSASCVRRLAVRVFECRRFGLGICQFSFCRVQQPLQRRQPGIFPPRRAVALRPCSGSCRTRAQPAAGLAAQRLHRQRQLELLAQQLDRRRARRRGRTRSSDRPRRSRAPPRRRSRCAARSAARTARRPAISNGSRHRPHSSSSRVVTRPATRNASRPPSRRPSPARTGAATR